MCVLRGGCWVMTKIVCNYKPRITLFYKKDYKITSPMLKIFSSWVCCVVSEGFMVNLI